MDSCASCSLIFCIILCLAVLISLLSMDSLEPLQYGLVYNKVSKKIGKEVYESGRYLIGPFNNFIIYPANLITIEFSNNRGALSEPLQTRTAEGLTLLLHVSFQYKLVKDKIPELYNLAYINYQQTIIRMARDVIMKVAGNFNANHYWTERKMIGQKMREILNQELQTAFTTCEGLQIIKIDLPKSYEDSIVSTQVEVQYTNMRKFEQQAELIRQDINVIVSQAQQQIRVTNATATAEAYKIKQFAQADALRKTIEAESTVFENAKNKMDVKGQDFTDYYYYTTLMDKKSPKMLVGLQSSIVNFGRALPTAEGDRKYSDYRDGK